MKKANFFIVSGMISFITVLILYFCNSYILFNLSYIFMFVFVIIRLVFSPAAVINKLICMIAYIFIMVVQIVFNTLITFSRSTSDHDMEFTLVKIFGAVFVGVPFMVEHFFLCKRNSDFFIPSLEEWSVVSYAQLVNDKDTIKKGIAKISQSGKSLSKENMLEIIGELPRLSSCWYVSNGSLTEEYFDLAYDSLKDEFIYIIITNSGSNAYNPFSVFINKPFNHVFLSFDMQLNTIISYNGGVRIYPPGLNPEMMDTFHKNYDSSIMVYRLKAAGEQKKKIIDKMQEINELASAYKFLELDFKYFFKPNTMFSCRFVYKMLTLAGLIYFQKKPADVLPTDFVELDYYRKLEFAYEIKLSEKSSDLEYRT